jgi:hypothetical protein
VKAMNIKIDKNGAQGEINLGEKISGKGTINHYSWCLSCTSSKLILEIADDASITPDDLPLVGYGCAGWIFERNITFKESEVINMITEGFLLFNENKLKYLPAVTCSCSDL